MANLLETGRPYLHMRAGTFIKNLAREYQSEGEYKLKLNTQVLESLLDAARKKETQFYIDFGVSNALEYSEKYLARDYGSNEQIAYQIWNSKAFKEQLYNKRSNQAVSNILKKKKELTPFITKEILKEINDSADLEKTLTSILKNLLIQNDSTGKNTVSIDIQRTIRESIMGVTKKKMRNLTTGGGVIPKLVQELLYDKKNLKGKSDKLYKIFKDMYLKKTGEKDSPETERILKPYRNELFNNAVLLSNQRSNVIGEIAETGEKITLSLLVPNAEVKRTSNDPVSRVGLSEKQKVKSKIDMTVTGPSGTIYYFQQKNTDKELFLEFENLGLMDMSNTSVFFNAHSSVAIKTFRTQVERVLGKDSSFDILEYLLVNINALNKGYKGPTLYKKETPNGLGVYSNLAMKMLSNIVSQYCQIYFSDLIEEAGNLSIRTYDFVTFDGRILIPMSEIYDGFLKNLKNTELQINKDLTYLTVGTIISDKGYTKADFNNMVKAKEEAVGKYRFRRDANYEWEPLVEAGKAAGQNLLSKIKIGNFVPSVNLASLIPRISHF